MSSRVRRMALGLATLTLLTSLFMVVQGFLNAPEALAACSERTWCDPVYTQPSWICCCPEQRYVVYRMQWCYWREVDCTINSTLYLRSWSCGGSSCWCPQ